MPTSIARLIRCSKLKNARHIGKGGVSGLSPSEDILFHCNKVLRCQKYLFIIFLNYNCDVLKSEGPLTNRQPSDILVDIVYLSTHVV